MAMSHNDWRTRIIRIKLALAAGVVIVVGVLAIRVQWDARGANAEVNEAAAREGSAGAEFLQAYKVFMHPRCVNCHPAGDAPLQGDDSRRHGQNVKRGLDGRGKYALKCANCHQATNLPGENMPPGNPNWHLPPPEMPLIFED